MNDPVLYVGAGALIMLGLVLLFNHQSLVAWITGSLMNAANERERDDTEK